MAEASRGRVTITLGRSGQVVKRGASAAEDSFEDSMGTKRSVRDRLGRSTEDSYMQNGSLFNGNSKRHRGDMGTSSSRGNRLDDVHIDKDDLRLKLMRKSASSRARGNDDGKPEDLRNKLRKTARHPISTLDSRRHMHEPKEAGGFGRIPSRRSEDDLSKMDLDRNSYSPWTMDPLRQRSPDRIKVISRGLSPKRGGEEVQKRPSSRTFDDGRPVLFMSKDAIDTTRPMTSVAFQSSSALPSGSLKPVAPPPYLSQLPPSSSTVIKSPFMVDEQQTVDGLLHSLGLGKYVVIFKAEEVDMTALKQMGENDLKELGIPMGPRKKILLSLLPRTKRQP